MLGPFDLSIRMVQEVPVALDRVRRQLVLARFIGKLAVDHGVLELRRRLDPSAAAHTSATVTASASADPGAAAGNDAAYDDTAEDDTTAGGVGTESRIPESAELELPDYEHLPAAHIVAKLAGLQQSDRDAIEVFESNHRHRRTILGKLEQLRSL